MGQQVALNMVVCNMVIHETTARKVVDLDGVELEDLKTVLGHHDKWWYPKQ